RLSISLCVFLFTAVFFSLPASAGQNELLLYSGAGLRQPVQELVQCFQDKSGIKVQVEYAGSGQIMTRYLASQKGDVFLPGSHFYVEKLKKKGEVLWSKPMVLHVPVVGFPKPGRIKITSFADIAKPGVKVGLGDPKAMALGRTAEDILKASGLGEPIRKNTVVRAATVKQLVLYLLKGDVDAAIVARADVFQKADKLGMLEIDPSWYHPEIVTVAVLRASKKVKQAKKLAVFLASPASVAVFNRYGFLTAK
ncbi:MAG: molybdate ABC transporter substrate-binding protein, partial [Desulfarculaceae bacterium]